MKKTKTIIIAGAAGLIGNYLLNKLSHSYDIIGIDVKNKVREYVNLSNIMIRDLTDFFLSERLFIQNNIVAYINCAYPRSFEEHCRFFMKTTENFAHLFMSHNISGSIINMSSIYGLIGPDMRIYKDTEIIDMPNWYSAAKGAVIAHSRCIATKFAKHNIKVNCIAPGGVYDSHSRKFETNYSDRVPLNRMCTTEDIYKAVDFLLRSDYITGQCIPVDGGLTAW